MQVTIILLKSNWDFLAVQWIKTVCSQCRSVGAILVEKYPTCQWHGQKVFKRERKASGYRQWSIHAGQTTILPVCSTLFSSPFGSSLFLFFPLPMWFIAAVVDRKYSTGLGMVGEVKTRILKYTSHQNLAFKSWLAVNFERIQRRFINIIRGYTRHSRSW